MVVKTTPSALDDAHRRWADRDPRAGANPTPHGHALACLLTLSTLGWVSALPTLSAPWVRHSVCVAPNQGPVLGADVRVFRTLVQQCSGAWDSIWSAYPNGGPVRPGAVRCPAPTQSWTHPWRTNGALASCWTWCAPATQGAQGPCMLRSASLTLIKVGVGRRGQRYKSAGLLLLPSTPPSVSCAHHPPRPSSASSCTSSTASQHPTSTRIEPCTGVCITPTKYHHRHHHHHGSHPTQS